MEHLDDPGPPPQRVANGAPADDVNWFPMVRAAFLAALTAFLVKLISLTSLPRTWASASKCPGLRGVHSSPLSMQTPPDDFARIVTSSTFVMAVVTTLIFTAMVLRTKADKLVVWGWFHGGLRGVRAHVLNCCATCSSHPWSTRPGVASRTPLTAGAAIAVVYSMITRERVGSAGGVAGVAGRSSSVGARSVDARPAASRAGVAVDAPPPDALTPCGQSVFPPSPPPDTTPYPSTPVPVAPGAALGDRSGPRWRRRRCPTASSTPAPPPPNAGSGRPRTTCPRHAYAPRPAANVGPAPIVDTRPAASRAARAGG